MTHPATRHAPTPPPGSAGRRTARLTQAHTHLLCAQDAYERGQITQCLGYLQSALRDADQAARPLPDGQPSPADSHALTGQISALRRKAALHPPLGRDPLITQLLSAAQCLTLDCPHTETTREGLLRLAGCAQSIINGDPVAARNYRQAAQTNYAALDNWKPKPAHLTEPLRLFHRTLYALGGRSTFQPNPLPPPWTPKEHHA